MMAFNLSLTLYSSNSSHLCEDGRVIEHSMLDVRNSDIEGQIGGVGGNIAKMMPCSWVSFVLKSFFKYLNDFLWKYGVKVFRTFITIKSSRSE
jgi:hypothetical protein